MVEQYKPDIVTMDIQMPKMVGLQATDVIMSTMPTPIVVISSMIDDSESEATFKALGGRGFDSISQARVIYSHQNSLLSDAIW